MSLCSPDPSLSPARTPYPPSPTGTLFYHNSTYRILQKPLRWHEALLLCETLNATLATIPDPYSQAFLTQAVSSLRAPLWIGLANDEVREGGKHRGQGSAGGHGSPPPWLLLHFVLPGRPELLVVDGGEPLLR